MSYAWSQPILVGVRDGVNKTFTIPNLPGDATVRIYFNGILQHAVALGPNVEQYVRVGANVTFGLAPDADGSDLLWAVIASESAFAGIDMTVGQAPAGAAAVYLQELRETFYFNVFVRDKQGNLKEIIEKDISAISWSYSPVGGCLEAQVVLRRPFDQHGDIRKDYEIEIWRDIDQLGQAGARMPAQFGPSGIKLGTSHVGTRELRWSGYVFEKQPVLASDAGGQIGEYVVLRCLGWSRRLQRLFVNNSTAYADKDVGFIVRDLVDNFVLAGSKIKRTAEFDLVQDTGVVVESMQFRTYAANALATLALIGGDCEWGVDARKELFFTPRQNVVKRTHAIGGRVKLFMPIESSDDEVNRVYLQGGDGVLYQLELSPFEAGNQKELHVLVNSVTSSAGANLWGTAFASTHAPGNATPAGRLQVGGGADWIENAGFPIGLVRVIGGPVFVAGGDRLQSLLPFKLAAVYGAYTNQNFRVQQINYTPEDDSLKVDVTLGAQGHEIADLLTAIENKLGEVGQALQA